MVLATATAGNVRDVDFLPLTVDVEERMYAAGKIPGSFFKREGRAGEKGTLTARMIDRPIRPLFPKGWRNETQIVAIPISIDHVNPYDILAMNGASAAIQISEVPVEVAVGAVRVGMDEEGGFVLNPPEETLLDPKLDLVVAGTEEAILMVEAGAKEVSEAEILDALDIAHGAIKKLCQAQVELRQQVGKEKAQVEVPSADPQLLEEVKGRFGDALDAATQVEDKLERQDATTRVEEEILEAFAPAPADGTTTPEYAERRAAVKLVFSKLEKETIRQRIAVQKQRPDGRQPDEIRPIYIEVDVAPRTHGSALFQRGQTQALSVAALGTTREEMRLDTLGLQTQKFYFHHYNFPPFSVGEAGRLGGPKRRDIGHGALAERALVPVVPSVEDFPYTIRVVSDILESNGSSSMASVCGSSLSLMQAGVPIKRPVAGIAMGLIKEGDDYVVLSDIAGVEDHLGDMDFKVAGTEEGITALQMDIKITGVTFDILRDALVAGQGGTHVHPRQDGRGHHRAGRGAVAVRTAYRVDPDRRQPDRHGHRQGRRDDSRPVRGVRGADRRPGRRHDPHLRADRRSGRRPGRPDPVDDQGGRDRRRVHRQGREDDHVRCVRRALQGHRRPAAHLEHLARPARRLRRGRAQPRRRGRRARGRGRQGARPHRPASGRGSRDRRQDRRGAVSVGTGGGGGGGDRGGDRGGRGGDRGGRGGDRGGRGGRNGGGGRDAAVTAVATRRRRLAPRPRRAVDQLSTDAGHTLTELDSGIRVVTEAVPSVRSVALGFWIGTGSRHERVEQAGVSHFLEHLLFKGTSRFSSLEIDQIFDGMGAEVNAGTGKETTSVYSRFLDQHLDRAFDVMADMVLRPAYADVDSERQVVIEEIAMYEDEPSDKVHDVLADAVFGDHPLGRPIIGTAEVVGQRSRSRISPPTTTRATSAATS